MGKQLCLVLAVGTLFCAGLLGCGAARTSNEQKPPTSAVKPHPTTTQPKEKTVATLIQELRHPDPKVRGKSAWDLGNRKPVVPEAVGPLSAVLADEDSSVRIQAAQALDLILISGTNGVDGAPAVPALIAAVKKYPEDVAFCRIAVQALGTIGAQASEMVPLLVEFLEHPDSDLRIASLGALQGLGPEAAPALPALLRLLRNQSSSRDTHGLIAEILAAIGPQAKEAIPWLLAAVEEQKTNRIPFIRALGRIGGAEARKAVPLLTKILQPGLSKRDDPRGGLIWEWFAAAEALAELEPAAVKPYVPDLIAYVRQARSFHNQKLAPGQQPPQDPYYAFENAALATLRKVDAKAAAELGLK